ncbi:MAG: IS1380 family transposase [Deltaproteobacteria bacterium]|nr:IS1380 family transposase [Deltaproteobacteria bacterium]
MNSPQTVLSFNLESEAQENITRFSGLPLVAEAFRALGLDRECLDRLQLKERDRGLNSAQMVESFLMLFAAGGENLDDFCVLRGDKPLSRLVEHNFPSPTTAWRFLRCFEEEKPCNLNPKGVFLPQESVELMQLGAVNRRLIKQVAGRRGEAKVATIDIDAKVIESHKKQAQATYLGFPGYQPLSAVWAELGLVVADEFRDGNVVAGHQITRLYRHIHRRYRPLTKKMRVRSDTAGYQHEFLYELVEDGTEFAIGADMSQELRRHCEDLDKGAWKPLSEDTHVIRTWAEVSYVPEVPKNREHQALDRYVVYRVKKRQGELFADGDTVKYFAIVTNMQWRGDRLIRWYWEKAGTIEHCHHVLARHLGAGVVPSKYFNMNAAYYRLNILCLNLLQAIKLLALDEELRYARPKRLRFLLFGMAGRIVKHARKIVLRVSSSSPGYQMYRHARERLAIIATTTAAAST